ncbi:hypothetical protein GCM10023226_03840 [Nocardioides nanhaiensis]|uniref:Uncharacterized protein n=1 Tax=Nocardioides nanhaiensis TaxID=1476871 RepID=A0ABP8VR97_9ACTN
MGGTDRGAAAGCGAADDQLTDPEVCALGRYEIHNLVLDLEDARAIQWRPGYVPDPTPGALDFGGWTWRYDLTSRGSHACEVVHTDDWSAVGPGPREYLAFPPFPRTTSRTRCSTSLTWSRTGRPSRQPPPRP